MIDIKTIDALTKTVSNLIPLDAKILKADIEKNIRAALQSQFETMDLVSREEFDAQSKLLMRSREKLEALEKKLAQLENESQ